MSFLRNPLKAILTTPSGTRYNVTRRFLQTLNFGGTNEEVVSRSDYPPERIKKLFNGETFAMLGYGSVEETAAEEETAKTCKNSTNCPTQYYLCNYRFAGTGSSIKYER
jgi:hypothetical protein